MFKNLVNRVRSNAKKFAVGCAAVAGAVGMTLAPKVSQAATLDFTGVGTAITAELTPAITAAMPIAGIILAAGIGWKLYKRFCK